MNIKPAASCRRVFCALLSAGLGMLLTVDPAAAVAGNQYFTIGGGGGMIARDQPCTDLPCNGNDSCSCVTASGNVSFSVPHGKPQGGGTFVVEVSADKSSRTANGIGGSCYGSGGYMVITTTSGTLTLNFAGPACRLGAGGGGVTSAPYGISSSAAITSGTGSYANAGGAGTLAATFDPSTKAVYLDLVAYGLLKP